MLLNMFSRPWFSNYNCICFRLANFHCLSTSLTRCPRCVMKERGILNLEGMNSAADAAAVVIVVVFFVGFIYFVNRLLKKLRKFQQILGRLGLKTVG